MAYKCIKNLICRGTKTKKELLDMCDVYFATGRLTEEQFVELVAAINEMD